MVRGLPSDGYRHEPEPVVDRVARTLRTAILNGELKPGQRIRQEAVAEACKTSRIPVREALRELAMEGLVTLEPNVGARVAPLNRAELEEVFLMRERLEPLALSVSGPKLTAGQLESLRKLLVRMEGHVERDEMDEWLPLSREFHMTAYQAAGMPRLLSVIHALWDTLDRYRRVYYEGEDAVVQSPAIEQAEHQMILEALERGDPTSAAGLIEIHIRRGRLSFVSR